MSYAQLPGTAGQSIWCTSCQRMHWAHQTCVPVTSLPQTPRGCICPPGANKDCESPICPRKPMQAASAMMGGFKP